MGIIGQSKERFGKKSSAMRKYFQDLVDDNHSNIKSMWGQGGFPFFSTGTIADHYILERFVKDPPEVTCVKQRKGTRYSIIYEREFEEKIGCWGVNSLDATWFALKLLYRCKEIASHLTGGEILHDKICEHLVVAKTSAVLMLKDCITVEKLFSLTNKGKNVSLHTIHSGLGALRALSAPIAYGQIRNINSHTGASSSTDCDWNESFGKERYASALNDVLGGDREGTEAGEIIDECHGYTKNCLRAADLSDSDPQESETAGFVENRRDIVPTISAAASATWCIWQLGGDLSAYKSKLFNFVSSLKKDESENTHKKLGVKNSIIEKDSLLCALYYAARILYSLESSFDSIDFDPPYSQDKRDMYKHFVLDNSRDGGFAPKFNVLPTMIHTKDAFALMQKKYGVFKFDAENTKNKVKDAIRRLPTFWKDCSYDSMSPIVGFSSSEYYFPNVYATLLLTEIDRYIMSIKGTLKARYIPVYNNDAIEGVVNFVMSCMHENISRFIANKYAKGIGIGAVLDIKNSAAQFRKICDVAAEIGSDKDYMSLDAESGFRNYSHSKAYVPERFTDRVRKQASVALDVWR
jgi:hypothetical protein